MVFRDGSCAIGMFRAITEINVLVQLRWDSLITQWSCTFHGSRVVSQHSSRYVNCGFKSWSTQLFYFIFLCFHVKEMHINTKNVMTENFLMLGVRI